MPAQAWVVMPGGNTRGIDFEAVFQRYLKPALEQADLRVTRCGDVHAPAGRDCDAHACPDLVVADLTLGEPREASMRELLAAPRTIRLVGVSSAQPGDAGLHYHLQDGVPAPAYLDLDRMALAERARALCDPWQPRQVFLFSGHMIDAPDRPQPRFPAQKEADAARAISATLDAMQADPNDLAICGGACGGDLIFAEAALARGCRLHIHIQFEEPAFLEASVAFAGDAWMDRYRTVTSHPNTRLRIQPNDLGPPPAGTDPYERNNLWQLHAALARGPEKVHCIALWNGAGGAGPGGARHMVETVRRLAGEVNILDSKTLFGL